MQSVILSLAVAICVQAATWTGKVDETYTVKSLNLHAEGVLYWDGDLYAGSAAGQRLQRFDPDDLKTDSIAEPDKTSDAHTAGAQIILGLCGSNSKDRIYGCLSSFSGGSEGIGYWDDDDLTFKKSIIVPGISRANDCEVSGDYVYFTSSYTGQVIVCDRDLDACTVLLTSTLLSPLNGNSGANGIVVIDDFLIVGNFATGNLIKVPVKDGATNGSESLVAITDTLNLIDDVDGLVEVNDRVIIAITSANAILLESSDKWVSAEIKKTVSLASIDPTGASTAGIKSDDEEEIEIYVTFPSWASLQTGTAQENYKIALVKFSDEDVDDLDFSLLLGTAFLLWFC